MIIVHSFSLYIRAMFKTFENMFNLDVEKIECALGNKGFCFWQGKKAENVVFLFLMLEFAAFNCL